MRSLVVAIVMCAACSSKPAAPSCGEVEEHFVKLVPAGAAEPARALVKNHCARWSAAVRSCLLRLGSLYEGQGTMPCFEELVADPGFRSDLTALNTRLTALMRNSAP